MDLLVNLSIERVEERTIAHSVLWGHSLRLEVRVNEETKKTAETARGVERGRRDKGDKGIEKVDQSKGVDYQVPRKDPGASRDAVKEDR